MILNREELKANYSKFDMIKVILKHSKNHKKENLLKLNKDSLLDILEVLKFKA